MLALFDLIRKIIVRATETFAMSCEQKVTAASHLDVSVQRQFGRPRPLRNANLESPLSSSSFLHVMSPKVIKCQICGEQPFKYKCSSCQVV